MIEDFYSFRGNQSESAPDAELYFGSVSRAQALSYLGYALAQGEGFIIITGEAGAGKSTLVAHMIATLDPAQLTLAQVVISRFEPSEIMQSVAQGFGLDVEGRDTASAVGALEAFLHEEARAGRRCLLVVDQAQNLSVGALPDLCTLSHLQLAKQSLLQTILLGGPEFREPLQKHPDLQQLRRRVIAVHHLMPMQKIKSHFTCRQKSTGRVNRIADRLLLLRKTKEHWRADCMAEDLKSARGAPIAELQRNWIGPGDQQDEVSAVSAKPGIEALREQIARLEARILEQERTIHHTLAMLVEWVDAELGKSKPG